MNTNFYLKKLRADKLMTVAFASAIIFFVGMIGLVADLGEDFNIIFMVICIAGGVSLLIAYLGIKLTKREMNYMRED